MSFLPGLFPAGAVARAAIGGGPFPAGDQIAPDIYTLVQQMAASSDDMAMPAAGGTLTINGEPLGSYDYVIKDGNQTVSFFFSASDWFTNTADSRSAFVVVKGNLTIASGPILTPPVRKLFTTIYVTGDLTVDGGISMTARGANHSASGSNISAAAIRIATGTYSGVTNPQVPAAGAAGSPGTGTASVGVAGSNGTNGQTGGGGSGGTAGSGNTAGSGADGTSFGGGSASGGSRAGGKSPDAEANGGAGGNGFGQDSGGGAGNPGGNGNAGGQDGGDGTGGVLIVICEGTLSGSGTISADGVAGGNSDAGSFRPGGGGSGGGSVTVLYGTDIGPMPTATGGAGGIGTNGRNGGAGGDGTARKLAL